jgi:hypothetical protein
VSARLENDEDTRVLLKNGWYPEDDGWCVNSAGIVVPPRKPDYVLVVLSCEQPSFEDGLRVTETIAGEINETMAR